MFALFAEQRRLGAVELVVRAKHNRSQGQDVPKLFDAVRAEAAQARLEIQVEMGLRWKAVELPSTETGEAAARLHLVHVR